MISAEFAHELQWPTQQCNVRFSGIDGLSGRSHRHKLVCNLISRFSEIPLAKVELVVVPQVVSQWLPRSDVPDEIIPIEIRETLEDPNAHKSAPIRALLGAGIWAAVIQDGGFTNPLGIAFQPSRLGWLIFGGGVQMCETLSMGASIQDEFDALLEPLLRRFWELEEVSLVRARTAEHEQWEEFLPSAYRRLADGRHEVGIPLRQDLEQLGSSSVVALHRYRQLERRFQRDHELEQKYCEAMAEMIREGHMQLVDRLPTGPGYHIPHRSLRNSEWYLMLRVVRIEESHSKRFN